MNVPSLRSKLSRTIRQVRAVARMVSDEIREDDPNLDAIRLELGTLRLAIGSMETWIADVHSLLSKEREKRDAETAKSAPKPTKRRVRAKR